MNHNSWHCQKPLLTQAHNSLKIWELWSQNQADILWQISDVQILAQTNQLCMLSYMLPPYVFYLSSMDSLPQQTILHTTAQNQHTTQAKNKELKDHCLQKNTKYRTCPEILKMIDSWKQPSLVFPRLFLIEVNGKIYYH